MDLFGRKRIRELEKTLKRYEEAKWDARDYWLDNYIEVVEDLRKIVGDTKLTVAALAVRLARYQDKMPSGS